MSSTRGVVSARTFSFVSQLLLVTFWAACGQEAPDPDLIDASVGSSSQALMSDADGDGIGDANDNCPFIANADQRNTNGVGPGDACELSLVLSRGLLQQYARFGSYKELVITLAPLSFTFGPDLMRLSAPAPKGAFANMSLFSEKLGVRSPAELLPGAVDAVSGSEALRIEVGSASQLGGAKASEVWLRLDGTAGVSVKLLTGTTTVTTVTTSNQGSAWKRFSANGTLFDAIELRVTSGRVSIQGGGEAVLFALARAALPCPSGYERVGGSCVDIDECAGIDRLCDPLTSCTNTDGSFVCGTCPIGYRGDGLSGCRDLDECADGSAICSALVACANTAGGYRCGECPAGYRGDGHSCTDIDECAEQTDSCDPLVTCTNKPGSYECGGCPSGYVGGGQTGCSDVDECSGPERVCDPLATCTNRPGGFECGACPSGYRGTGATSCVDVDECTEGTADCSPLAACGNTPGSYQCGACPDGYSGDGHQCTDVDECALGTHQCSELAGCQNTVGGYTCGACPSGYTGDGHSCTDIDECVVSPCDARVTCQNTAGGYLCGACPAGFTGDGYAGCVDMDECNAGLDDCSPLVTCGNTLGGYTCSTCPTGYTGDGHSCQDVDECAAHTAECDPRVTCTNTEGSYTCGTCPAGFTGDGHTCSDIDECAARPCDALTVCTNVDGSYRCSACPQGYAGDGYAGCVDIDECAVENGGCAETDACMNTAGSRSCVPCAPGDVGVATHCGVGACAATGLTFCQRGQVRDSCSPGVPAVDDASCDGVDGDCDGQVDEDYTQVQTSCGLGACARSGWLRCVRGQTADSCQPGSAASSDATCDAIDNDCDGHVDEDFAAASTRCGLGGCERTGVLSCTVGQTADSCEPGPPAASDVTCNATDDDCDGAADEEFAALATSCGLGACQRFGTASCVSGEVVDSCTPGTPSGTDECNGFDDDCDGQVDEDFVPSETSCGSGACTAIGTRECVNGAVVDTCAVSEGRACDDGDACNGPDSCDAAGVCQPSSPGSTLCCDGAVFQDPLVRAPVDPTLITSFAAQVAPLYEGADASQWPVVAGAISPESVSVIQGRVLDENGAPLPCAAVSALNAPHYGTTRTRADGTFRFAVNGGTQVTLRVELPGYMPARRAVDTGRNRYVSAQTVRLMTYGDPQAVSASGTTPTLVAGELETDASGSRRATLLFPAGTTASVAGESAARQAFAVRVKEVTNLSKVGRDGMLASLPVQSAFTYAVSLSVAGAEDKDVTFNQPVPFYVENFLGFPVGETVPAGRWDDKTTQWIAEESGRVIGILSVDANGRAVLDLDKNAGADDPATLGISDAERATLAARYAPGTSLWRVRMQHFSLWDINWGWGPDADARSPDQPPPTPNNPPDNGPPCEAKGSVIECESRVLREHIAIAATPYELVYSSARQAGSARELRIPITVNAPPPSVRRIALDIEVAGRTETRSFSKAANQTTTFEWDGTDAAGRLLRGPQIVHTRLGYTYGAVYKPTSRFGYNGSGTPISGDRARFEVTLSQDYYTSVGSADASYAGLGGWTLSDHHVLEPKSQTLYLGDGRQERVPDSYAELIVVAGTGLAGRSPDGTPALSADLYLDGTTQIAVGPDGSTYFVDAQPFTRHPSDWKVRKIGPDGTLQTVNGGSLFTHGIDVVNNELYYDDGGRTIVKRDLTTQVETFVTTAPTSQIRLAAASDGSAFIQQNSEGRLWHFRDGSMALIATGLGDYASPALHPDGGVIIAQSRGRSLVHVGVDNTITRIAGSGTSSSPRVTDGSPTLAVDIPEPSDVAVGPDGLVYFAERSTASIYRITADQKIERVVGTGTSGVSPPGTPGPRASLRFPSSIAFGPDGSLYIQDTDSRRILRTRILPRVGSAAVRTVPSSDGRELFAFDQNGRHLWTTDAYSGARIRVFGYDNAGSLRTVADRDGRTTTIERAADGTALAIVAPDGQRTELQTNSHGQLIELVQPDGGIYGFRYTAGGLLTSMKDPKAHAEGGTSYTFEYERGKLLRDRAPTGGEQVLTESASSSASTVARATSLGRTTVHGTERIGRALRKTVRHPDGTQASSDRRLDAMRAYAAPNGKSYDSKVKRADGSITYSVSEAHPVYGMSASYSGETVEIMPSSLARIQTTSRSAASNATDGTLLTETTTTTINGRATTTTYNSATRSFVTTSPAGRRSARVLDAQGRVARVEPPGTLPIEHAYDANGRLERVTQGDRETAFTYATSGDGAGYLASSTNPLDETTTDTRDALGRALQQSLPDAEVLTYRWDALGNMTGLTPPGKPEHAQSFDPVGQQLSYAPPALASIPKPATTFEYNLDRELTGMLRPDGVAVNLAYEGAGKLDIVTTPFGNYDYDYYGTATCAGCAPGKLSKITSPYGVGLQFTYDGALLKSTNWSGAVTGTLAFTYDNEFRVSAEAVNTSTVRYGYEADSLVTCASMTSCAPAGSDALRTTWDPLAPRVTGVTLGGTSETRTYNAYGELASIRAMHGSTLLYAETLDAPTEERDGLGRIVTRTETTPSGTTQWKYEYDPRGRLTLVLRDGELYERLTYDANGNRIRRETPDETIEANYDAQDRLLTYGPYAYTYTARGELRMKTDTRDGTVTTYTYDARGNLVRVDLPDGNVIEYIVDGMDRRVAKKKNGVIQKRWLYRDQLRIAAELDGAGNLVSRFIYASRSNVPDFVVRNGIIYRVMSDHLGSPRVVVNANDSLQVPILTRHDAWGTPLEDSNPGWIPFGFAGGLYDPETGFVRFGARDYDPYTGRWTAKDPILFAGAQANLFSYVDNDPVNFIDPVGSMKLPADPSGLGPEWSLDPSHRYPNGQRYRHPSGDFLDFHKGDGKPEGRRGRARSHDHWHLNDGEEHFYPGDEIPDPASICEDENFSPGPSDDPVNEYNWQPAPPPVFIFPLPIFFPIPWFGPAAVPGLAPLGA